MATFSDLKTAVSVRMQDENNTAISASDVGKAVNAAIRFWKTKKFWFNEFRESVTLAEGSTSLPLPSTNDLLIPFDVCGVMVEESGNRYEITALKGEDFDAIYSGNIGRPYIYTYRGGSYNCYFLPDKDYTMWWHGLKDYDDLVNDSDSNDFTTNAEELIKYEALKRLTNDFLQDTAQSDRFEMLVMREKIDLLDRTNKLTDTGHITIYDL